MPQRSALGLVAAALLTASCGAPTDTVLTAQDSLIAEIFVELHLLQARTTLGYEGEQVSKDSVFARYDLTQKDFDMRMDYYAEHPEVYSALYNLVMDHLGREIHEARGY